MDTILNIDLDFLTKPYYVGNHYLVKEWKSFSDFKAIAKPWISAKEVVEGLKLKDKMKGDSVASDKQVLFSWEKAYSKRLLDFPCRLVNLDAHLDMYAINSEGDYYDNFSLGMFNDFDHLIALFKYKWVDQVDWIVPDYFTNTDINAQFNFLKPVGFNDSTFELYVSEKFNVKVKIIKWSDFKEEVDKYNFKFMTLVLNEDKSVYNDEMINTFNDFIKR